MFGLGGGELLLIFFLALIFIGPKKLPELAKSLGKSIREFQKAKDELMHQVNNLDSTPHVAHEQEKNAEQDQKLPSGITPEVSNATKDSDKPA
ncbi:MAG: hypothetical protein OHK0056_12170 [Bacteriovoracaceae bacterium]